MSTTVQPQGHGVLGLFDGLRDRAALLIALLAPQAAPGCARGRRVAEAARDALDGADDARAKTVGITLQTLVEVLKQDAQKK
jgi:hypothetical protein